MSAIHLSKSFAARQSIQFLVLLVAATPIVLAQAAPYVGALDASQSRMLALPDSPGAVRSNSANASSSSSASGSYFDPAPARPAKMAAPSDKFITPDEQAPALTAKDKFLMGAKSAISPFSVAAWVTSAGYSHLTDGAPNYGTDSGAFGQRLGATVIRDISQDFFSTSIMANVFHEDPRYYQLGRSHSFGKRVVYAATRAIITRTDSGRTTPNLALLSGNLAGSILTNAYYPPLNHGFSQTMQIFGSSIGGSALGFGVSEFLSDALQIVHLKKAD